MLTFSHGNCAPESELSINNLLIERVTHGYSMVTWSHGYTHGYSMQEGTAYASHFLKDELKGARYKMDFNITLDLVSEVIYALWKRSSSYRSKKKI